MPAIVIDGRTINFEMRGDSIIVDGKEMSFHVVRRERGRLLVKVGESVEEIIYADNGNGTEIFSRDGTLKLEILSDRDILIRSLRSQAASHGSHSEIKAPMPGLVVKTLVNKGDRLKRGAKLVILEAMKMENELRTPVEAEVEEVLVKEGDVVEKDQVIVRLR